MKVLVIDDVPIERKILSVLLTRVGHRVVEAADVAHAKEVFSSERPDFVLTDLHLIGESGLDFARHVRALPDSQDVRILLMSGDAPDTISSGGLVDAVLQKPISLKDLSPFLGGSQQ